MLRSILSVIVSYIAMFIFIVVTFMGLWFGMGVDGLLQPGSYKGNMLLCIAVPCITIIAGILGGRLCFKIARGRKPVMVLAGIVFVLGAITAYFTLQKPELTGTRPAGMKVQELMEKGREPTWVAVSNPIIGALGVLVGGLCLCAPRKPT